MAEDTPTAAVEAAASELETQIVAVREGATQVAQHVDSAKSLIAELQAIQASLQTLNNQAREAGMQVSATAESVRASATTVSESAARVEALKAEAEQSAQLAATRSGHVEDGLKYVNEKRTDADALALQVQQSATSATAGLEAVRSALGQVATAITEIQSTKAAVESDAAAVGAAKASAEVQSSATRALAELAHETQDRIAAYEARLTALQESSVRQAKTIDELLLGATNAGLASAFDQRSRSFKRPKLVWQVVFIATLGALVALAAWEAASIGKLSDIPQWQDLARMLVHRLPFLIPLIWLAIHAARQAALAMRMEEEYAFKATISTSFEGYRRQMADVSSGLAPDSPLAKLCSDTLETISTPPGDVYDKHRPDPTPATAGLEMMKPLLETLSKFADKLPSVK